MKRIAYAAYAGAGVDRLVWRFSPRRLRILAYHGVCDDDLAPEPWMPSYFVTRSAFEEQMRYLKRHACVLPLAEAVARLRRNDLPDRAVSITFDDGYANNLHAAYPILQTYQLPATIFLATGSVDSGMLFPFIRLQLIQYLDVESRTRARPTLRDYLDRPVDDAVRLVEQWWTQWGTALSDRQIQALRPLRRDEIANVNGDLIEFGAHTHGHCILGNETPDRRRAEIAESIRNVAEMTGRTARLFSYPNGRPGDFGDQDKRVLHEAGIAAAVTTSPGANGRHCDPLALRRYSIGLLHTGNAFAAAVTGVQWLLAHRASAPYTSGIA